MLQDMRDELLENASKRRLKMLLNMPERQMLRRETQGAEDADVLSRNRLGLSFRRSLSMLNCMLVCGSLPGLVVTATAVIIAPCRANERGWVARTADSA